MAREGMKINLRYMQKNQKTIILDKRTAKTELMKNNITKNFTIGIARQNLRMDNEYEPLIIDGTDRLNTSNTCPFSSSLTPVHGNT